MDPDLAALPRRPTAEPEVVACAVDRGGRDGIESGRMVFQSGSGSRLCQWAQSSGGRGSSDLSPARRGDILFLSALVAAAASLVLRFRRSHGIERQQLKWFALAGASAGVMLPASFALWYLTPVAGVLAADAPARANHFSCWRSM